MPKKASNKTSNMAADPGVIIPDRLYSFSAFEALTGVGRAGIREARAQGLEVRYFGRSGYIYGREIIRFILENGRTSR